MAQSKRSVRFCALAGHNPPAGHSLSGCPVWFLLSGHTNANVKHGGVSRRSLRFIRNEDADSNPFSSTNPFRRLRAGKAIPHAGRNKFQSLKT